MPAARKPSTSASRHVVEDPLEAQLGAGAAARSAGGLGQPDLVGELLALEGDRPRRGRPARRRCWSTARWRLAGRRPPSGRSIARVPRSVALRRRTAGRSAGRAGARRPGVARSGRCRAPSPRSRPSVGSSRSCGTNRSRPQSSAFSSSRSSWSSGVRRAAQLLARRRRCPATAITSSRAVAAGDADGGDAEPGHLGDALGDQLQGVARGRVRPARRPVGRSRSAGSVVSRASALRPWSAAPCTLHRSRRVPDRVARRRVAANGSPVAVAPLDSAPCPREQPAQGRRRPADGGPRPAGPGTPGRLRRLRRLGAGRGRRQADLLRPLRPAAPRPGVRRHRGQQRPPDPGLQGHGPGLPGLRRDHPRVAARATSPSGTPATPPPARAPGRTPSRRSGPPPTARSRWATTAT